MLKVSGRTAIRFYIILVFLVFARELYTAYSPEGEKYEARVIEIYNQMEYPSNTHIVSYDLVGAI